METVQSPRKPLSLLDCPYREKFSPYIQSQPILFHRMPVVSHPTPTHHYKKSDSVFSVLLIGAGSCCEVLRPPSHLQPQQALFPRPLIPGQVLQHLTIVVALLNLLQFVKDFLVLVSQNWLLYLDVV